MSGFPAAITGQAESEREGLRTILVSYHMGFSFVDVFIAICL